MNVIDTPDLFSLCGNPMRFVCVSGSGSGGGNATYNLAFTGKDLTENHTLVASIMGSERVFTLKSEPTDRYHWPVATAEMTVAQWVDSIQDRIERNVDLVNNYTVTRDGDSIVLEAISEGSQYDIEFTDNNLDGVTITGEGGGTATSNVQAVLMQLRDGSGVLVAEEIKVPDSTFKTRFDISGYLKSVFSLIEEDHFHPLFDGTNRVWSYSRMVYKYRCSFAEKINGYWQPFYFDWYRWAVQGGLNRFDLVFAAKNSIQYFQYANNRFLTWAPVTRKVGLTEPVSLYFLFQENYPNEENVNVFATVYDTGGESYTMELESYGTVLKNTVIEIQCGFTQLEAENLSSLPISRYEVYLGAIKNDSLLKLSETRVFIPDYRYSEFDRNLVFKNSFECFDTLRVTGVVETRLEHDRKEVTLVTQEVEKFNNAPDFVTRTDSRKAKKATTGWLSREYLVYLEEFMGSTEVYEVDKNGLRNKVKLTSKKTELLKDKENRYKLTFEYENAHLDQFYSQLNTIESL